MLLTLSHAGFAETIRVSSDGQPISSGGHTYNAFPFRITMPDETDDAPPKVMLQIDNVDRQIVEAVRSVQGDPIIVDMSVVMVSSPDTIEAGPFTLSLRNVNYDALTVDGQLQHEDILIDAFPGDLYTPAYFPGLFA